LAGFLASFVLEVALDEGVLAVDSLAGNYGWFLSGVDDFI